MTENPKEVRADLYMIAHYYKVPHKELENSEVIQKYANAIREDINEKVSKLLQCIK